MGRRTQTSQMPYLVRAMHEWMMDNSLTPHLLVDTTIAGVDVPVHAIKDGRVVLNVATGAVDALFISGHVITFAARFNKISCNIVVPFAALLAIYAKETGEGMAFDEVTRGVAAELASPPAPPPEAPKPTPAPDKRSHLRVIK